MPAINKGTTMKVEEAAKLHREGYILIDVRPKEDYDFSHVVKAVNCPYSIPTLLGLGSTKNKQFLDQFIKNVPKETKILIMGKNGSQAKTAAAELSKAGYTSVVDVDGGVMAWQQHSMLVKTVD